MIRRSSVALSVAAALTLCAPAFGQAAGRFDLSGPSISVHVQRGDQSLPIAEVPNLQANDKLTIHADLPKNAVCSHDPDCGVLRGSTNPPPESWFTELKDVGQEVCRRR